MEMTMPILNKFLERNRGEIDKLSVWQVVTVCGNGQLRDRNSCSEEFRDYLSSASLENLSRYCRECLDSPFTDSGSVLQDLVNELGRRLDFEVENGAYRGRAGAVGHDGLWRNGSKQALLVEVKTSDAYRINLDTVMSYRDRLAAEAQVSLSTPCLIVVGREDTGDLEAQVRGSRHAWSIRIISTDALLRLVELKQNADENTAAKTRELLVPFEYTRLDRIIDLAFTAASEASAGLAEELSAPSEIVSDNARVGLSASPRFQDHTPGDALESIRSGVLANIEVERGVALVRKSRAIYWSVDRSIRAVVSISKLYPDGWFWYGYHSGWDELLSETAVGMLALGCVDRPYYFELPFAFIHDLRESLNFSPREDGAGHWHIHLLEEGGTTKLKLHKTGSWADIDQFRKPLVSRGAPTDGRCL